MTEKRYDKYNPRFRDEFGCVNDLMTGESYLCGENGFVGERDAIDTAIALCTLLNALHEENQHLTNIIDCLEKGSCRSIDSFLDTYCTEEMLKEFDLE